MRSLSARGADAEPAKSPRFRGAREDGPGWTPNPDGQQANRSSQFFTKERAIALKPARLAPPLRRRRGVAPPGTRDSGAKVVNEGAGRLAWAAASSAAIASAGV